MALFRYRVFDSDPVMYMSIEIARPLKPPSCIGSPEANRKS